MKSKIDRKILMIILLLVNCGCSLKSGNLNKLKDNEFYFFPKGVFNSIDIKDDKDSFYRKWYSNQLISMNEPSLLVQGQDIEFACRFLWLRSFHHPIAIRVEKQGEKKLLYATELSGMGGYKPGKVKRFIKKEITANGFNEITQSLIEIDFWNMSTIISIVNPDGTITVQADGAEWILEVRDHEKYHIVQRWLPENGKFKELCLLFLKLSEVAINSNEIY